VGIAAYLVAVPLLRLVFRDRPVDEALSQPSDDLKPAAERPGYTVEEHADGTGTVMGEIEFHNFRAVGKSLPAFQETPDIEFVRERDADSPPQIVELKKASFIPKVNTSVSYGYWTWIATGRLKEPLQRH
jgi:hypothetical protein